MKDTAHYLGLALIILAWLYLAWRAPRIELHEPVIDNLFILLYAGGVLLISLPLFWRRHGFDLVASLELGTVMAFSVFAVRFLMDERRLNGPAGFST